MKITKVNVTKLTDSKDATKALASVEFEDSFIVTGIRVIEGSKGLFVTMPQRKAKDNEFHDICFPKTKELRAEISAAVLDEYGAEKKPEESTPNFV